MSAKTIRKLITIGLIIILAVIFGLTTKNFFSARNLSMIFRNAACVGLVSVGVSFVMLGGGIDLSTGGIICFVGILCARLGAIKGFPAAGIIVIALAAGALCGCINGLCVTKLHLTEFITTLSTGYLFSGLAVFIVFRENGVIANVPVTNKAFLKLGGAAGKYFYYIAIVWVILTVLVFLLQTKTKFGLHTSAVGSSIKSAGMSGVNTDRIKILGFMLCELFCAVASMFTVSYQSSANLTLGGTMGFEAVAACVVGGIVLGGGRGDGICAFLGALFMTMLSNGIQKYGLSTAWTYMSQGIFILAAIFFDTIFGRISELRRAARIAKQEALEQQNALAAGKGGA